MGDDATALFDLPVHEPDGVESDDALAVPDHDQARESEDCPWNEPIVYRKTRKTIAEKVRPMDDAERYSPKRRNSPMSLKLAAIILEGEESIERKDTSPRSISKSIRLNSRSYSPHRHNDERSSSFGDHVSFEIKGGRNRSPHEKTPPSTPDGKHVAFSFPNIDQKEKPRTVSSPAASASHSLTVTVSSPIIKLEQKELKPGKFVLELSNISSFRQFLTQPLPPNLLLQCVITRQKGTGLFNRYPMYELHLDPEMGSLAGKLLMCAKRQSGNKTSNYHISMDRVNFDTQSKNYLGKVRSNFLGNEYVVYDDGVAPSKAGAADRGDKDIRQELGAVQYMPSLVASQPRELQVVLPNPGNREGGLLSRFKSDKSTRGMTILQQKKPRWNEVTQAYGLNFHGRVKCASVKNFVLINVGDTLQSETMLEDADMEREALLFGKLNLDEKFSMDIRHPLSPLLGFGICLSAFDPKLATE